MADQSPGSRTVEVDDDVYDVLERTAASRDTDINSALRSHVNEPSLKRSPEGGWVSGRLP
ncbi:hypothetical protein ACLQ24_17125 [Micromonospora sp. DT4]|uniref:hypothetical protein n=1 Tax=Micromonospora sp. DT4 TaxID=3393438 RepID=UPI003CEC56C3